MKDLKKLLENKNNIVKFRSGRLYRAEVVNLNIHDENLLHTGTSKSSSIWDIMEIREESGKVIYDRDNPVDTYEVDLI